MFLLFYKYRSFAKPPKPVQTICECILVMKAYKEISWKTAKAMMSEGNFLKSLMEMDVDAIGGNQVRSVSLTVCWNSVGFTEITLKLTLTYLYGTCITLQGCAEVVWGANYKICGKI